LTLIVILIGRLAQFFLSLSFGCGMKKSFFLIFVLLHSFSYAQEPFRASAVKTWTVDTAREEAFREAKPWVDVSQYSPIDPNLIENRIVRQGGGGTVGNRIVTVFTLNSSYCVQLRGIYNLFYYNAAGKLLKIEFFTSGDYPIKSYMHSALNGTLESVGIITDSRNSFAFSPSGELFSHWLDNKCYGVDGSSCGTRYSFRN
jgi:hypothetical protein